SPPRLQRRPDFVVNHRSRISSALAARTRSGGTAPSRTNGNAIICRPSTRFAATPDDLRANADSLACQPKLGASVRSAFRLRYDAASADRSRDLACQPKPRAKRVLGEGWCGSGGFEPRPGDLRVWVRPRGCE